MKLLSSPFLVMLQAWLSLKDHWKGHWALQGHSKGTPRALQVHYKVTLGHSKRQLSNLHLKGTSTLTLLKHLGARNPLGYLGTWAFRHLGTRRAPGHLGTWHTRGTLYNRIQKPKMIFSRKRALKDDISRIIAKNDIHPRKYGIFMIGN